MWGNVNINILHKDDPEVPVNEQHAFGGHSDVCTYCGIGRGWFSTHEGEKCNARVALRRKVQEYTAADLAAIKKPLPAEPLEPLCVHGKHTYMSVTGLRHWAVEGGDLCEPEPPQPKPKPLQQATGRKFR